MVTAVPSRFAVLSIEDDDYKPRKNVQKSANTKSNVKTKDDKQKPLPKKDERKKQNKGQGKKKRHNPDNQQWEQWKQKDSMVVEETYEQQLHEAIMLSKLSYQESQTDEKPKLANNLENTKKPNKKSKKSTMSLEEFNSLNDPVVQNVISKVDRKNSNSKEEDAGFFEKIEKEVNEELIKEKEKAALRVRLNQLDDNITSAQLRAEVEKRDNIIIELKVQIESLKEELSNVKNRNKKLYQILQQGEMKDKAAILAEVTKLQDIRDELTSEVTSLHAQLEQERSKIRASSAETKSSKQSIKKRLGSENA